ncbi:MAG: hypothetical protein K8W52_19255 [Deltaproteobacteria bacterium]|nr:hypothetical protein [Deltaproteobacteria bacterium]
MRMLPQVLTAALATTLLGGCFVRPATYGEVSVTTPGMVYIDSDVQVVADYEYPVFYSSGAYWRFDGGYWYRSPWRDRSWSRTENVPVAVRRVPHPENYAHYTPGPRDHRVAPAPRRLPPPREVDHRTPVERRAPAPPVDHRAPAPEARPPVDHRAPPPRTAPHEDRGNDHREPRDRH